MISEILAAKSQLIWELKYLTLQYYQPPLRCITNKRIFHGLHKTSGTQHLDVSQWVFHCEPRQLKENI